MHKQGLLSPACFWVRRLCDTVPKTIIYVTEAGIRVDEFIPNKIFGKFPHAAWLLYDTLSNWQLRMVSGRFQTASYKKALPGWAGLIISDAYLFFGD